MTPFEAARHPFLAEYGLAFLTDPASSAAGRSRTTDMLPAEQEYQHTPFVENSGRVTSLSSVDVLRSGGTGNYMAKHHSRQKQFYPIVVTPRNLHHKHEVRRDAGGGSSAMMDRKNSGETPTSGSVADIYPEMKCLQDKIQQQMKLTHSYDVNGAGGDVPPPACSISRSKPVDPKRGVKLDQVPDGSMDHQDSDVAICLSGDEMSSSNDGENDYVLLGEQNKNDQKKFVEQMRDSGQCFTLKDAPSHNELNQNPKSDSTEALTIKYPDSTADAGAQLDGRSYRTDVKRMSSEEDIDGIAPSSKKIRTQLEAARGEAPRSKHTLVSRELASKYDSGSTNSSNKLGPSGCLSQGSPLLAKQSDSGVSTTSYSAYSNCSVQLSTFKNINLAETSTTSKRTKHQLTGGAFILPDEGSRDRKKSLNFQPQQKFGINKPRSKSSGPSEAAGLNETFVVGAVVASKSKSKVPQSVVNQVNRKKSANMKSIAPELIAGHARTDMDTNDKGLRTTDCLDASESNVATVTSRGLNKNRKSLTKTGKHPRRGKKASNNSTRNDDTSASCVVGSPPLAYGAVAGQSRSDKQETLFESRTDFLCSDESNDSCASGVVSTSHSQASDRSVNEEALLETSRNSRKLSSTLRRSTRTGRRNYKVDDSDESTCSSGEQVRDEEGAFDPKWD